MKSNREYRNMMMEAAPEEKMVQGYATTFDEPYLLWTDSGIEYWEKVDRAAFDKTDMSDVIMQYDHEGRVFARIKNGTLQVEPDNHGLWITADLSGTEIGRQLYEEIAGGYTTKMSFGFTVRGEYTDREEEGGIIKCTRTITDIGKLYDVSAVSLPANDATEISVRNLQEGVILKVEAERLRERELILNRERAATRARALMNRRNP